MPKSKKDDGDKKEAQRRRSESAGRKRRAAKAKAAPPEEEVKVTDKRASREGLDAEPEEHPAEAAPETPPEPEAAPEPAPEPPPAEAPEEPAPEEPPEEGAPAEPLSVFHALRWCMGIMTQQAWQHLGLRADPATGQAQENLEQAEVAIDTLGFMYQRMQRDADADEQRLMETELANLRLNFTRIRRSKG